MTEFSNPTRCRTRVHRLKIEHPDQLDEQLGRWLAEAPAFMAKRASER